MNPDKIFYLPFRQDITFSVGSSDTGTCRPIKTYARFGSSTTAGDPIGFLGQTSTNDNCPLLVDIYNQLANYEFMTISRVEESFEVVDFTVSASTGSISQPGHPSWRSSKDSHLLWKACTHYQHSIDYSRVDSGDYLRSLSGTRSGLSFKCNFKTEMKQIPCSISRLFLTYAGRSKDLFLGQSALLSSSDDPYGPRSGAGEFKFNLGENSNLFYLLKGEYNQPVSFMNNPFSIAAKYWASGSTSPTIAPITRVARELCYPRLILCSPLVQNPGTCTRTWQISHVTTLVLQARGYYPASVNVSLAFLRDVSDDFEDDDDVVVVPRKRNK